ncbi:MAG TPA: hypothetical protein VGP07_16770 [Polyangia bacterium]|jgi:hypothetical protein
MKRLCDNWLLVLCGAAALAGCGSSGINHDAGGSGGTTGGSGGATTPTFTEVPLVPDDTGWVDAMADGNTLGVQGAWYPYGDQYGMICPDAPKLSGMKCNDPNVGNHPISDCSVITTPDPTVMSFPNTGGKMCTSGTIAKISNIVGGSMPDYSNVWGAGIGLDLNAAKAAGACDPKMAFPAMDKKVVGVKFDLDAVPSGGLRVEFPTADTDGTKNGSAYWGADSSFSTSSGKFVVVGTNTIYWDPMTLLNLARDATMPITQPVVVPGASPGTAVNVNGIESIQFHVPASTTASSDYMFCISNLKFLVKN